MTIEQLGESRVLIVLKSEDMRDFELDYGTLGFSDAHSRRILSRLLTLACTKTGMKTEGRRMLVEALPHRSGCLILLTLTENERKKRYRIKKKPGRICCAFDSADGLLAAAEALGGRVLPPNRLYGMNGRFYLVINGSPVPKKTLAVLAEFCDARICSPTAAAAIEEKGRLIAGGNAIARIYGEMRGKF